jgi:FSR family fosmidomycin resistance protein-like MFS transporter
MSSQAQPASPAGAAPVARPLHKPSLAAVTLAHISVDMQTASLVVLLPLLLASFDLSYTSAAAIISVNSLIIALAQPLFGVVSDRWNLRWLALAGCALTGLAMAGVLFLPSYWLVLAAVILSGIGSAAFHPEALTHVRTISGDQKATASSVFFFGGNLGFALGPLVAALLVERYGPAGAPAMLIPTAIGLGLLWSQRRRFDRPAPAPRRARPVADPLAAVFPWATVGLVLFLLTLLTLRSVVLAGLQTFIPLYFTQEGGMSKAAVAQLLTVLTLMGAFGTLFSGPIADRLGRRVVMAGSMAVVVAALFVFMRAEGLAQLVALGVAGAMITAPWTITVVMIQDAMPNNLGLAGGLTLGTAYGASGLGVAALGAFADSAGLAQTMLIVTSLPVLVLILSLFVPERRRRPATAAA